MPKSLRILLVSPEVEPFAKTGGLADVSSSLAKKLKTMEHDVRVFLPKYKIIKDRKHSVREVKRLSELPIQLGNHTYTIAIRSAQLLPERVPVFLLENKELFDREGLYVDPLTKKDYEDNAERFLLFCYGVFTAMEVLHWIPDIVLCSDWQAALIPYLLKRQYAKQENYAKIKTVVAIHNLAFQGIFPMEKASLLKASKTDTKAGGMLEFWGKLNFLKAGILSADKIITVSPTYAKEIQTPTLGFGLEGVLKQRKKDIYGILNGIDTNIWNPEKDEFIPAHYNIQDLTGKQRCKLMLQVELNLQNNVEIPMFGMIGRLTEQKGIDLIIDAIPSILEQGAQVVILGVGDDKYHQQLQQLYEKYQGKMHLAIRFDDELAHKIEAASDFFLMPSRFEPCGLNQMYSLRYGTIPIVHSIGGLADTVQDWSEKTQTGNGIVFKPFNQENFNLALKRAFAIYSNPYAFSKIRYNAMSTDFSWSISAKKYEEIFLELVGDE
ncbi:MAG: glycogen synthase GlgA [bacterium]|nr:glycogen synthase GlgA [bacterium]